MTTEQFDAIVIGSGFAGAVTACRLSEAGLNVCILERGRRYASVDLPVLPDETFWARTDDDRRERKLPDFARAFWQLGQGLWELRDLGDLVVGQAAGFGGGSLIYANVHLRAPDEVFEQWPAEYRDGKLMRQYYDLAAYVLDVQEMPAVLPKTVGLEAAAKTLEAAQNGAQAAQNRRHDFTRIFRPPLAVNFGPEGETRFGVRQGSCDMRGECCFGCTKQAKNTLDLNYLHVAEEEGAEVRTLAEVIAIELKNGSPRYEVRYRNHLKRGKIESIQADYVLLCAGAVNTTELLLRSRDEQGLPIKGNGLGTKFHPNVDELAVIFDCKEEQETDRGPTITTAWLYDDGRKDGTWLMVQDGGLPAHLEPMLGMFRSPLWLQRNAFAKAGDGGEDGPAQPKLQHAALPQRVGYAALPVDSLVDLLTGLTGSALASNLPLSHEVSRSLLNFARGGRDMNRLPEQSQWSLCPQQLNAALDRVRENTLADLALLAESIVETFINTTAEKMPDGLIQSIREMGLANFNIGNRREAELRKWALQAGIQGIWGSQAGLLGAVAGVLSPLLAPAPKEILQRVASLLRWALDYRGGDGHATVLLAMGRDSKPATLELELGSGRAEASQHTGNRAALHPVDPQDDLRRFRTDTYRKGQWESAREPCRAEARLRAHLPAEHETPERSTQESILRDLAQTLGGELRTSPLYPFLGRRVTVHAQGGCPMAEHADEGITKPSGEVFGCDGLYVMDAAAFPTPVGVNPSATITAVAERKVEEFIREWVKQHAPAQTASAAKAWVDRKRPAQLADAASWAKEKQPWLDPIGALKKQSLPPSPIPDNKPIGIEFDEVMIGTHRRWPPAHSEQGSNPGTECVIETRLTATIDDLAIFLAADREGTARELRVSGNVVIDLDTGVGAVSYPVDPDTSRIWLRSARDDCGNETRSIEYLLEFIVEAQRYQLDGIKDIRDDARFDIWEDTTTLCFLLRKRAENEHRRDEPRPWTKDQLCRWGVLRLPAAEFFRVQIPSLRATHVDDPARQVWAVTTFARFFFSHLVDVYVPALERAADVGKRVLGRGHV